MQQQKIKNLDEQLHSRQIATIYIEAMEEL